MRTRVALPAAILALTAAGAEAQRLPQPRFEHPATTHVQRVPRHAAPTGDRTRAPGQPVSGPRMAIGGLLGGAVGLFGGGAVGAAVGCTDHNPDDDLCTLGGIVIGGALGEALLLPSGVFAADRAQGNLILDVLTSAGIAAAGLVGAVAVSDRQGPLGGAILIATPLAQIWAVSAVERATARIRDR